MTSDSTAAFASADLQEIQASNGITYAFRRLGGPSPDGIPLVLLQHFRGNIDNWDPALIDGLAAERDVIAFDNAGVGGAGGTTPGTAEQMAEDAIAFLDALGLGEVDLFGFSSAASSLRRSRSPLRHGCASWFSRVPARRARPAWSPGPTMSSPPWSRPTLPVPSR